MMAYASHPIGHANQSHYLPTTRMEIAWSLPLLLLRLVIDTGFYAESL